MGSNLNFKNFASDIPAEGESGGTFSFPLTRQPSVYSLTFDEFQSTLGGIGKDFGSMNMDEFLKNIWSAEENQNIGFITSSGGGGGSGTGCGGRDNSLQRQGSLVLPRTLSVKTVDDVWRDISKEYGNGASRAGCVGDSSVSHRQPTLGEITLEEFLLRAGLVREEARLDGNPNNVTFFNDLTSPTNNLEFGFGYQNINGMGSLISGRIGENSDQIAMQSGNLPLSIDAVSSHSYRLGSQQQQLLPIQTSLAYPAPMVSPINGQQNSLEIGGGIPGITDQTMKNNMVKNVEPQVGGLRIISLRANGVETGSHAVSSDGFTKNNGDVSSVSPVPYAFNGGLRGRKVATVENNVERRHRRMIKNRESAARSRTRKQAYTMELEAEVAKLKDENQELQKKQADMMEMQQKQVLEMMNNQKNAAERRRLRRTCTGPW